MGWGSCGGGEEGPISHKGLPEGLAERVTFPHHLTVGRARRTRGATREAPGTEPAWRLRSAGCCSARGFAPSPRAMMFPAARTARAKSPGLEGTQRAGGQQGGSTGAGDGAQRRRAQGPGGGGGGGGEQFSFGPPGGSRDRGDRLPGHCPRPKPRLAGLGTPATPASPATSCARPVY